MELRRIRKQRGFSVISLASELGVQPHTVSRWETGMREPDMTTLLSLADILRCSVDEILGNKHFHDSQNDLVEVTAVFTETVNRLLELCKSIDEPEEITEMVADLIHNGEADGDATKRFVQLVGEAAAKSIQFLLRLQNTPEAAEALAAIEREMPRAA